MSSVYRRAPWLTAHDDHDVAATCGCTYVEGHGGVFRLVSPCEGHADDEPDYGGAFDGNTVTSDADAGL